jgi:hypothetical protein
MAKHNHEEAVSNPVCACSCDCKVAHGKHDLRLCSRCDTAYCRFCQKEWGFNSTYTPYTIATTPPDAVHGGLRAPSACSHA